MSDETTEFEIHAGDVVRPEDLRPLTDHVACERRIRELEAEVEGLLAQRNEARERAEAAEAYIDELLGEVSRQAPPDEPDPAADRHAHKAWIADHSPWATFVYWARWRGYRLQADPDGAVRLYPAGKTGRCSKGTILRSQAVAEWPREG